MFLQVRDLGACATSSPSPQATPQRSSASVRICLSNGYTQVSACT